MTADNITSSSATLNWDASSDNVGVASYNVYLDGNLVGTTSNTSFDLLTLSPLTSYNAAVNAQDAAGNVSGDATTAFTTLEGGGTGGGELLRSILKPVSRVGLMVVRIVRGKTPRIPMRDYIPYNLGMVLQALNQRLLVWIYLVMAV